MSESLHVVCPGCSTTNRVARERLDAQPRCGSCSQPLFSGRPIELDTANFDRHVNANDLPVVVDFWAPWCGPCRTVGKVLEGVAAERQDLKIVKINIDDNTQQAIAHGVMILPTVILYKDGKVLGKLQGGVPPRHITELIDNHLGIAD